MRFLLLCTLPILLALPACHVVQETGRRGFAAWPEATMAQMGAQAYAEETGKHKTITSGPQYQMVQEVGKRIAKASGRDYEWEFKLLDAPETVNAFALPGGKVAVYSGLLKLAPDADSLAAIMGHEVAHATSHHGNERMTQGMFANIGVAVIDAFISGSDDVSAENKTLILGAMGLGAKAGLMHYSRKHESEADEIGLRFAIRAGYDPHAAPKLWQRMHELNPNASRGWLSTHPHPLDRAKRLEELIPKLVAEERAKR